jgi:hypothetical protein
VLTMPLPPPFTQSRLTSPDTLAAGEIAAQLNDRGYRSFDGLPFQGMHVFQLRPAHGLKDRLTRLREAGMRTAAQVAARLGVSEPTIWRSYRHGWIIVARYTVAGSTADGCAAIASAATCVWVAARKAAGGG